MQAMILLDSEWNAGRINAALRAYRQAASAADAGVRDDEAFRLLLSAAESERGSLNGFL